MRGQEASSSGEREHRAVCRTCLRPESVCYCTFVPRLETRTRVEILQHPRERDVPINTARIAKLCLPASDLHVGVSWSELPFAHDTSRPAVLLYPGPGAIDIEREPPQGPVTLVVVDGTWWQARKIVRTSPALTALPRYAFRPPTASDYRIRKEPRDDYVSTVEALVQVLGVLEGDAARFAEMLVPFRAMVDAQISYASRMGAARERHARRSPRRVPRAVARLRELAENLVCIHAEANAWPYDADERAHAPDEIVQWVASRVHTGETFEAVVAPRGPLCPVTPNHTELTRDTLESGEALDAALARWSRFLRPDDVVCSWGAYPQTLLRGAGGELSATRLDLRDIARVHARRRVGALEAFCESIGADEGAALGQGRAGRRLAGVVAIARALTSSPATA
jgi:DTW domain-containing protein